jgi:hypothetical protein
LVTLGGTQTPQRPHSALPTPCIRRFELRFGCHTVVWTPSSNHLQQLGSPWGMGAMPPHPRDGRTLLAHLGGAHTHHHNHIRRCRHRIRRYRITVWVRFGCCMVVHVILSMQGHHGALPLGAMPPYPRDGRALLGHLRGATHTPPQPHSVLPMHRIRPLVRIVQRRVRVSNGGVHVILSM